MKIYFDGTEIDYSYIYRLTQDAKLFTDRFKLGSTVCRVVEMDIDKSIISNHPTVVEITDDWDQPTMYLHIDDIDDENDHYYTYTLMDSMILTGVPYQWTMPSEGEMTIQDVLDDICQHFFGTNAPTMDYLGDMPISWGNGGIARDFISYCAEVNASYAYMYGNELRFQKYNDYEWSAYGWSTYVRTCSSFTLGNHHIIDRAYLELATATAYYPQESSEETVYLNPDNILFNDYDITSEGDTESHYLYIRDIVKHIAEEISGFEFYDITVKDIFRPDDTAMPGSCFKFIDETGTIYPTILEINNWHFSGEWRGGINVNLSNEHQQETTINNTTKINKLISISVDRERGIIEQKIQSLDDKLAEEYTNVIQTANNLEIRVARNEENIEDNQDRLTTLETSVVIDTNGVTINQGTEGQYTQFTDTGMDIYVNGVKTAWATAEGFSAEELMIGGADMDTKWHLHMMNDTNTLSFYRR